ncbi:uncharacterized protein EURHEDRAFT_379759 [Aspergillus ruber CBS 135680]|uniref:Uncharacterized protein n=1 Tax=Aspergillus ruber (strain CBS 135680) TaxID=1388766 RepID=A0A017S8N1_ASPRC|nr:uncharacterized protein EURHEDRAFT_379759 [Aspergillus ruber CBS 135680]EYE92989.1 hypothetical protein EURHEDRAFT_379759 [Aspergillus ruber CBS 135680]
MVSIAASGRSAAQAIQMLLESGAIIVTTMFSEAIVLQLIIEDTNTRTGFV